jgi:hypothetical protein
MLSQALHELSTSDQPQVNQTAILPLPVVSCQPCVMQHPEVAVVINLTHPLAGNHCRHHNQCGTHASSSLAGCRAQW